MLDAYYRLLRWRDGITPAVHATSPEFRADVEELLTEYGLAHKTIDMVVSQVDHPWNADVPLGQFRQSITLEIAREVASG